MYFALLLLYALIDLWGGRGVTSHREATEGSFSLFTFLFYSLMLKDFGNTNKQQVKNNSVAPNRGGVLRSSISWLARCVELKAWVSCPTKVALF